jgi:radical SAM protein with 4Fe4S-binding SPASM domain
MLPADEYERVLRWFDERSQTCPIDLKATCAPHYYRIRAQRIEQERRQGNFTSSFIAPGTKAKAAPTVLGTGAGHPHGQHLSAMTRGCLAGTSVCFVSNEGAIYPCGYLPVSAGDTRLEQLQGHLERFAGVSAAAGPDDLRREVRRLPLRAICGGCRARAYAATGSFLAEEPFCTYRPDLDAPRSGQAGVRIPPTPIHEHASTSSQ